MVAPKSTDRPSKPIETRRPRRCWTLAPCPPPERPTPHPSSRGPACGWCSHPPCAQAPGWRLRSPTDSSLTTPVLLGKGGGWRSLHPPLRKQRGGGYATQPRLRCTPSNWLGGTKRSPGQCSLHPRCNAPGVRLRSPSGRRCTPSNWLGDMQPPGCSG